MPIDVEALHAFIVRAKAATYVGDGEHTPPCRTGSHDLRFREGEWAYHDSYFGGTDFIGEEVVYLAGEPVCNELLWAYAMTCSQQHRRTNDQPFSRMYRQGGSWGGLST
jgi:hypothetical protein